MVARAEKWREVQHMMLIQLISGLRRSSTWMARKRERVSHDACSQCELAAMAPAPLYHDVRRKRIRPVLVLGVTDHLTGRYTLLSSMWRPGDL
jgi:hypothetical protein